jgi:hypothetical protein
MKHLLKIVGIGLAIWLVSLLWLDINRVLMWPLFAGFIAGLTPAYLIGRIASRRHQGTPSGRVVRRPRSIAVPPRAKPAGNMSGQPTRPSPVLSRREQAASPTHPMPVV